MCWLNMFSYIFVGGYVVGYYSYKWVEVLLVDVYVVFEEVVVVSGSVFDVVIGMCYCCEIFEVGGSCLVMELFKVFCGCEL